MDKDGIQVDKNGRIVYNIPPQASAMFRSPTPSPTLMFCSGITFALASPHWVLSGTIPCFIGPYGAGVMHLLNMREMGVGMGLMLSIFACDLW